MTNIPENSMTIPKATFVKRVWWLIRPYWKSEERWMARLLLAVIIALSLGEVYLHVLFNQWNNAFYDSLQEMNKEAFKASLIRFSYLAAIFIVVAVYKTYLNQMLQIKWRRWMTGAYLKNWLAGQNYYRMQLFGAHTDNPDQRIAEDIDQFIQLTLGLLLEGMSSVVTLFSFLAILWTLSGALDFTVHGYSIHIPGYMVWVAFAYAFCGTWLTFRIGRPLARLNYERQRFEANFRFSLVRLRENTESIAFYKGEPQEEQGLLLRFGSVVNNWLAIMKRQKKLNWFTSAYGQIVVIFPFVVAAPRYFAGEIKLGGLMQTSSAFMRVQGAMSYLVDSFTTIANWKAVIERLEGFNSSIYEADAARMPNIAFERIATSHNTLEANNLFIRLPDGKLLLKDITLTIKPGDSLLITGVSGSGKSTLLRTLAGLWPFVEGKISVPDNARMLFVPQKSYLPLGTLADVLCYPEAANKPEEKLREVLSHCLLGHLADRLGDTDQWSHVLSLGEQQRIAFARVLLAQPDFVFLDEATSALDEEAEAHLYRLLKEKLPNMAMVSVGHRASLRTFHAAEKVLRT